MIDYAKINIATIPLAELYKTVELTEREQEAILTIVLMDDEKLDAWGKVVFENAIKLRERRLTLAELENVAPWAADALRK